MPEVKKINWGGVNVNDEQVAKRGRYKDERENIKYYIEFKDGKKVEYYDQKLFDNQAEIKYDGLGHMNIFDLKIAQIQGSKASDSFVLDNCSSITFSLYDSYDKTQDDFDKMDKVVIKENCKGISVFGDEHDYIFDYTKNQKYKMDETEVRGPLNHIKE